MYKSLGTAWTKIAEGMRNRTKNDVINRFYSTLRRVARKAGVHFECENWEEKTHLLKFVDVALSSGHFCYSKRGRKSGAKQKAQKTHNANQKRKAVFPQEKDLSWIQNTEECHEEEEADEGQIKPILQELIMQNKAALNVSGNLLQEMEDNAYESKPLAFDFEQYKELLKTQIKINDLLEQTTARLNTTNSVLMH
jgi:hypothetical protein